MIEIVTRNELARQIVETVPDAFLILDARLRVQLANRAFYQMFQVAQDDTEDRYIYDLGTGQLNIPELRRLLEEILPQNKTVENFEVAHDFPDIGLRTLLINARRVYQEAASSDFILLIVVDITERRMTERALTVQAQELSRSNTELAQFAYVASHDLQEPLRMVASYLQLLEQRYKGTLDQDADDFINLAVDGAARMKVLINDLLAYSRVGHKGKSLQPVDCQNVLKYALTDLEKSIAQAQAVITSDPLPTVMGDQGQIIQVFENLLTNGIKFHGDAPPRIHITSQRDGDYWRFSVRDNGIGIESEYWESIFLIFERLHSVTSYSGTGIGLAITKKIVEQCGGRIWVQSEPDAGSEFLFTLPILRDEESGNAT